MIFFVQFHLLFSPVITFRYSLLGDNYCDVLRKNVAILDHFALATLRMCVFIKYDQKEAFDEYI